MKFKKVAPPNKKSSEPPLLPDVYNVYPPLLSSSNSVSAIAVDLQPALSLCAANLLCVQ